MSQTKLRSVMVLAAGLMMISLGCSRNPLSGSKLTTANYDQVTNGMSKSQVERILGKPTSAETKDMIIFKKTTYKYEDGKNFAIVTFKNDELDSKDTNLGREP